MTENTAGSAIDSQTLFKQQQQLSTTNAPIIVAIDLQTPANVGSVYRIADAMACKKIIFVQQSINDYKKNKTVKRTSRNTQSTVLSEYWTHEEFHSQYKNLSELIAIELTTTAENLFTSKLVKNCSFVIGSERYGIPDSILEKCHSAVKIPMFGHNGSMNVSHALAICLYEWHRQHTKVK